MTNEGDHARSAVCKFSLLGGVELTGIAVRSADVLLAQAKVVGLLAYLALAPSGRYQRRDRLVGLLWPELDQSHARAALRKAVFAIRGTLGDDVLIGRGDEELLLSAERVWCDAREFASLADSGRLTQALELYRGELMPGFHLTGCAEFGSWLDQERMTAARSAAAAAWALAVEAEECQNFTHAGKMARRVMQFEWTDERVLRRTMLMLQRIGDRAGAIRVFEDFVRRLAAELDATPSAESTALADGMRRK